MKIVGLILQVLVTFYFKVFFLLLPKSKIDRNLKAAIKLYQGQGFGALFAKIRSWDAPYSPVNKLIKPNAKVLDLGCGDGLLANYLAIASPKRKILGVELNKDRVKQASKGLANVKFKQGDILKENLEGNYDTITLIHVLHHLLTPGMQTKLLEKIARVTQPQHDLIILEIDRKPFLKYLFSAITDAFIVPILFEGRPFNFRFFYRTSGDWEKILSKLSFSVKIKSIHKGMPFSHVLIYAKKVV